MVSTMKDAVLDSWDAMCKEAEQATSVEINIYNKYIIKALILDLFSRVKKMFTCAGLNMKLRRATCRILRCPSQKCS